VKKLQIKHTEEHSMLFQKVESERIDVKGMDLLEIDMQEKPDEKGPFAAIYGGKYPAINVSRIIYEGWSCGLKDRDLMIEFVKNIKSILVRKLEIGFKAKVFEPEGSQIKPELEPFWNTEATVFNEILSN
jgi:hypothetical protein